MEIISIPVLRIFWPPLPVQLHYPFHQECLARKPDPLVNEPVL
jgi:hypothetical protein